MEEKYKEYLKNNCKLVKDIFQDGLYVFDGECAYGLCYLGIPIDCKKIQIFRMAFTNLYGEELYPIDKSFTNKEMKELMRCMKRKGFVFSRASGLDDYPIQVYSVSSNYEYEKTKLYYYFRKY